MQIISLLSCVTSLAVHIGALCVPCDAAQWPDVANDPIIYVNNPIEADLPSHWVPLSVLKQVVQMRASKKLTAQQTREPLNYKKIKPAEYNGKEFLWGKKIFTPRKKTREPDIRKISNEITIRATSRPKAFSSHWSLTLQDSNVHTAFTSHNSITSLHSEVKTTTIDTRSVINPTTKPASPELDESTAISPFATTLTSHTLGTSPTNIASISSKNGDILTITAPLTSSFSFTTTIPDIPSPVLTSALITSTLPTFTSTSASTKSASTSILSSSASTYTTTPTTTATDIATKRKKIKTKESSTTTTKSSKKVKKTTSEGTGDPFY